MRIQISALALAAAFAHSTATAQNEVILPQQFTNSWGDAIGTGTGLGTTGDSRAQYLYTPPFPIGSVILEFGFRKDRGTAASAAFTADMEVRMSSTPVVPGTASATFANNVGTDEVVVLPRAMYTVPAFEANRSTGEFVRFPLPVPFVFGTNGETNLCVEVLVYSTTNSATGRFRVERCFGANTSGTAATNGIGCGAATIGSASVGTPAYTAGTSFDVTLSNASPNLPAFLSLSFNMNNLGGIPFPVDLSLIGTAPDCDLLADPQLTAGPFLVDAAGDATINLNAPMAGTISFIGLQWLYLVPPTMANPLGLETTALRQINFGPRSCPNQYVYDLFDVNATSGTIQEGGAVLDLIWG